MSKMYSKSNGEEENKIDGLAISRCINEKTRQLVNDIKEVYDTTPTIAIILVGDDVASKLYVNKKNKLAREVGIVANVIHYESDVSEEIVLRKIKELNADNGIHGIMVQMPLPLHINANNVLPAISPLKDIDGLHPLNAGLLTMSKNIPYAIQDVLDIDITEKRDKNYVEFEKYSGLGGTIPYIPCTPLGCLYLINSTLIEEKEDIVGKNVVVFGNSNLVSKPMARLLLQSGATTTTIHTKSGNFSPIVKNADIIVVATGRELTLGDIKSDAILIDVGIHVVNSSGKIRGDLDYEKLVKNHRITPVPFGVGPMTTATLMINSYLACLRACLSTS